MICERCGKKHDGSFGSGRFCSRSCANTRIHSDETKAKIGKTLSDKFEKDFCSVCGKQIKYHSKTKLCVDCLNHTDFGKSVKSEIRDANGKLPRNNWENLRNNWNLANPSKEQLAPLDHNINVNSQMPNYSLLKINYNEKHF